MDSLTAAAASGLQAQLDSFDLLANNLANASTSGFKLDREFYSTYLSANAGLSGDEPVGASPLVQKQWTDFTQGTLQQTGNPTDIALAGTGFFSLNGPSGPLFTRNGSFRFSPAGTLVSAEGYPVRLVGGTTFQSQSASPIQVGTGGQIMQDGVTVGQLEIVDFGDRSLLSRGAGAHFENADVQRNPSIASSAQVLQGKVEASNVAPAESAARMVSLMRHFEMLQRAIKVGTEMNKQALEEVARVTA